jgi:hypothetical protein
MFDKTVFLTGVKKANMLFNPKTTSLRGLLAVLPNQAAVKFSGAQRDTILRELALVPSAKQQRYTNALNYLLGEIAGVNSTLPYGIPINPKMALTELRLADAFDSGKLIMKDGYISQVVHLSWISSNGVMSSLSQIQTRERVKSVGDPTAAPFNHLNHHDLDYTFGGGAANFGGNDDDHFFPHPTFICRRPLSLGLHRFDQVYEYSHDKGATWLPIPGAVYVIEKGVRQIDGQYVMYFKKTGNTLQGGNDPFHLEVEFEIGDPPAKLPAKKSHEGGLTKGAFFDVTKQEFETRAHARFIRTG